MSYLNHPEKKDDQAKQLATMPGVYLLEEGSSDVEEDLEKEDIESFNYDNLHLAFSNDDLD